MDMIPRPHGRLLILQLLELCIRIPGRI
jgi:hypothetical protein